jgi:hypothetical protein
MIRPLALLVYVVGAERFLMADSLNPANIEYRCSNFRRDRRLAGWLSVTIHNYLIRKIILREQSNNEKS